jgi:hypothetical protein
VLVDVVDVDAAFFFVYKVLPHADSVVTFRSGGERAKPRPHAAACSGAYTAPGHGRMLPHADSVATFRSGGERAKPRPHAAACSGAYTAPGHGRTQASTYHEQQLHTYLCIFTKSIIIKRKHIIHII